MDKKLYSMKEACKSSGFKYETLKYYCNLGLVPNVKRGVHGERLFSERDLKWLDALQVLKGSGMGISDMQEYVEYCLEGESGILKCKAILEKQEKILNGKMQELYKSKAAIREKQQIFDDVLAGRIKYYSYLIET